jgi:mono/diheme cytochrome c family protein
MKKIVGRRQAGLATLLCVLALTAVVFAGDPPRPAEPSGNKDATNTPAVVHSYDADAMRVQGEQRFRANCGRCHAAPQKFPPRMMATVLRHMRVRATITDQDMRLVLFYMTQ